MKGEKKMLKKIIHKNLKDLDDISYCHNCISVISDQPDYHDDEDIVVCAKCGAVNKKQ